jgi:hypothetical protein
MAAANNVVASVLDSQITVNGSTVTIQLFVQSDSGRSFNMSVSLPISNTAGQDKNTIFSAVQAALVSFGDNMPANASFALYGGRA